MATAIQFRFPECQKIDLNSLIARASESGLQLLNAFLQWDSDKRPSAQQSLKYPFFQINKSISDPIHASSLLLAKQQQMFYARNQGFSDDRKSHASMGDAERFLKDNGVAYRQYGQFNTLYRHTNGIKPSIMNDEKQQKSELISDYLTDVNVSATRNKPENGINSTLFNGDINNFTSSLNNNNYQSEVSADDSISRKNPFTSNTSDTGFSSIITTRNSDNSSIVQPNYSNKEMSANALHRKKSTINYGEKNSDNLEYLNGIKKYQNSRNIENKFLNEKISDIYVNRNIGKLYDNSINGSIFNNKIYNGVYGNVENNARSQDFMEKNQKNFLHENESNNENKNSKIYNIFSKQRNVKQTSNNQSKHDDDENGYLLVKKSSGVLQPPARKSMSIMRKQDSFEDKELDRLLG